MVFVSCDPLKKLTIDGEEEKIILLSCGKIKAELSRVQRNFLFELVIYEIPLIHPSSIDIYINQKNVNIDEIKINGHNIDIQSDTVLFNDNDIKLDYAFMGIESSPKNILIVFNQFAYCNGQPEIIENLMIERF